MIKINIKRVICAMLLLLSQLTLLTHFEIYFVAECVILQLDRASLLRLGKLSKRSGAYTRHYGIIYNLSGWTEIVHVEITSDGRSEFTAGEALAFSTCGMLVRFCR